jgi:hypothetical protein
VSGFARNGTMLLPPKMSRESKQRVFTNPFVPLIVYCRASRKLPSEVAEWTQYMKRKTGASFFILAAYSNADGQLVTSK